ncbi:MAG: hypothetical protein KF699_04550 [Phycisphaeraceae bacterium]|nr:hypothetical protein [Phycisphaeraceae bacterium]MBX3405312.1 hypothetical protein [Phycisphaeraceae bacterium]
MMLPLIAAALIGQGMAAAQPPAAPQSIPAQTEPAWRDQAREMSRKAAAWLATQQDPATGGWSVPEADEQGRSTQPHLPGITALVLTGLLDRAMAEGGQEDELPQPVLLGVKYLLNWQQPDGGIYDRALPSYNTSLAVSALSRVQMPRAREAVNRSVSFLRSLQWSEFSDVAIGGAEAPRPVERNHPFYGGVGYGRHGRPDGSNLNLFMQALEDAGVEPTDPAVRRALVFLQRLQMTDAVNDMPYADGSSQGGFIYATVENAQSVDGPAGQSMAGSIEETLDDGTRVSRLRAYGSMTYAGFKSYLYADLARDDPRVAAALEWIRRNYTVDENPGMGSDGLYYYYVTFARALAAWGEPTIAPPEGEPADAPGRDWRADLVARLGAMQNDDGSFRSVDDRWMENNPVLITAYALVALNAASK